MPLPGIAQNVGGFGGDPFFQNVILLMPFNSSITGQEQYGTAQTMTVVGGPVIDTSQFLYGGGSIYFDGTGDNLNNNSDSYWDFGTNDFTVEFAFRTPDRDNNWGILDLRRSTGSNGPLFETSDDSVFNDNGRLIIKVANSSRNLSLSNNRWYQVAMSRVGSFIYCYVDGTLLSSAIDATGISLNDNQFTCGTYVDERDTGTNFHFRGWVDQLRITRGIGRYSGSTYKLQGGPFPNY